MAVTRIFSEGSRASEAVFLSELAEKCICGVSPKQRHGGSVGGTEHLNLPLLRDAHWEQDARPPEACPSEMDITRCPRPWQVSPALLSHLLSKRFQMMVRHVSVPAQVLQRVDAILVTFSENSSSPINGSASAWFGGHRCVLHFQRNRSDPVRSKPCPKHIRVREPLVGLSFASTRCGALALHPSTGRTKKLLVASSARPCSLLTD